MKLLELAGVAAITGVLAAIALPNYLRYIKQSRYTQAVITVGSALNLGECPKPVKDWVFDCNEGQISAKDEKNGLKLVGVKSREIPLICKGVGALTESQILSGQCPIVAAAQ